MSAGTCSRISAATTRSNSPSANGSASASPSLTSASAPAGTSPASRISANMSLTFASSSASWSNAITSAPRRYISKACRPAPQPMSSVRSPGTQAEPVEVDGQHMPCPSRDGFLVRRGGGGSRGPPAEPLVHAGPAGGAHTSRAAPGRRGAAPGHRPARSTSPGVHQVGAQPVRADDLGDRPRVARRRAAWRTPSARRWAARSPRRGTARRPPRPSPSPRPARRR